nr:GGDEF domain-containing response regulator [Aliikangiella sp. G2MR2-5]
MALISDSKKFAHLLEEVNQHHSKVLFFDTIAHAQQWLELNPQPGGLIVDLVLPTYQSFLTRFSLRYPQVPIFCLKEQPETQFKLRLRAFCNRIGTADDEMSQSKAKILLVDDSKTIQVKYKKILQRQGYLVDLAGNAEEGFSKMKQNQYDLAIIDYYMPGDTGAELCAKMRADDEVYELEAAILTAEYKAEVVDKCIRAGARECMFKNESEELFLTRVRTLVKSVESKRQISSERSRLIGLLNSVAEGVYGITPDGRIQFVNPATMKLLGQSLGELMGCYPHEVIHPTDNSGEQTSFDHCFLQQAYLLGDELREWRTLFQRSDGSLFPVECNLTNLGDGTSNLGSVVVFRDISEQQRLEKNWQWQLSHDHLTGLLNRSAFEDMLNRELNRVRRTKECSLLLFIDLDRFKLINDELGHAAGDQLLINLAENLKERSRGTDYLGRMSGDEFLALLTHVSKEEFAEVIESYRLLLEETLLLWEGKSYSVTGSIGAVVLDQHADSIGECLARADSACQRAKQKGKNQWDIYEEQSAVHMEQGNWYQRLTNAMKEQQFTLLEQPVYSTFDSRKIGANCLLRLREGAALISPAVFMSNAKRFGVITKIDEKVVDMLVSYAKENHDSHLAWYSLSLSIEAMSDETFLINILDKWYNSGLLPKHLRFEFAEEDLFNFPQWKSRLSSLRAKGFGIIISHFGMNSSSVLALPQMPVDAIKLDTSLTRELETSLPRCNLIDAIVKTARQNSIEVIATHIESAAELELLQARDVDMVQGFYLAKPDSLVEKCDID